MNATSGSAGVLLDVSQDNAMDDSDILDEVGVLARDVVANERAEEVAALGAMVVDERFGSLLGGLQGDAMDDSGGQGFGGVFAGGASVEERTAAGGGRNQGPRWTLILGKAARLFWSRVGVRVVIQSKGQLSLERIPENRQPDVRNGLHHILSESRTCIHTSFGVIPWASSCRSLFSSQLRGARGVRER